MLTQIRLVAQTLAQTSRSTSGLMFMLNDEAISWRSKRQPTIALSFSEAEFNSASAMVQEVIFLRKFLSNLGFPRLHQLLCLPTMKRALPGLRALLVAVNALNLWISVCISCSALRSRGQTMVHRGQTMVKWRSNHGQTVKRAMQLRETDAGTGGLLGRELSAR
jgi:hypothetical protein